MNESFSVAEYATQFASAEHSFTDKMLLTGRVLVKKMHEETVLSEPTDEEILQYTAPELRSLTKHLFKIVTSPYVANEDSSFLPLRRVLSINQALKNDPETISIYDKTGKKVT